MQLFAIIAGENQSAGRDVVALFLRQQLNKDLVLQYLVLFDEFVAKHHGNKSSGKGISEKRTSLNSVKVLRICDKINEELAQKEKYFVLLRLLEFVHAFGNNASQEKEFMDTVAEAFNIEVDVYHNIIALVEAKEDNGPDGPEFLEATGDIKLADSGKHIYSESLRGKLIFLRIEDENLFFVRYFGRDSLYLNGQLLTSERNYVFSQGSSIRSSRTGPIFYSDVLKKFLDEFADVRIVYRAENVSYYFPHNHQQALHQLNIIEESGSLVGIMGASGSGKSTLLNVLNGNEGPTYGKVTINGYDVHLEKDKIQGVLGYVSQDDLLIEELSVFNNIYYNAKLCFAGKEEDELTEIVNKTLQSIGLFEVRDLRVGSILEKTISGGQRKRLNIALELIREPSVLFVDEPTSGLSSRDSENIMDLLKELTLRGKLIFVVIHQPSSEIFKMFDRLFILDQGGYPIYYGNPVESIVYFRKLANHANHEESECPHCGNVNPEQVFNIIESKVVDEYGNLTEHRKISPKEWNNFYNVILGNHLTSRDTVLDTPKSAFNLPSRIRQFFVYLVRDVLSKLSNRQYMLINFLEAPVLALVLSLFIKYFPARKGGEVSYVFSENLNIPQYFFIAVIVALFLGLTVSAEEIIRDQKILKREKYLNLSRGSYLMAKITIMFLITAVQTLCFVSIGNGILEIKNMLLPFWLILFSTSCFANMLGLNISASFNSAKVIYILIPILIIPQLLFSGVIVRFDRLYPAISSQSRVPLIGNIMTSRWAFEALAVYQFKNNAYDRIFFDFEEKCKTSNWKKDFWIADLKTRVAECRRMLGPDQLTPSFEKNIQVIQKEMKKEMEIYKVSIPGIEKLTPKEVNASILNKVDSTLDSRTEYYKNQFNFWNGKKQAIINEMTNTPEKNDAYLSLLEENHNESLDEFMNANNDISNIVEYNGELVQKTYQAYSIPIGKGFFDAQFYAPSKNLLGRQITTISANVTIIWLFTVLLAIALFFDVFRRVLQRTNYYAVKLAVALRLMKAPVMN